MRKVFAGLAMLLTLALGVQFFLAASGAFDPAPNDEAFGAHRALGYGVVLLAVLTTVGGALARVPGRLVGMAGLVVGLGVLQPVIRVIAAAVGESATAGQLIFGLHALNGMFMVALAVRIVQQARELSRSASATDGTTGASGSAARPAQAAS